MKKQTKTKIAVGGFIVIIFGLLIAVLQYTTVTAKEWGITPYEFVFHFTIHAQARKLALIDSMYIKTMENQNHLHAKVYIGESTDTATLVNQGQQMHKYALQAISIINSIDESKLEQLSIHELDAITQAVHWIDLDNFISQIQQQKKISITSPYSNPECPPGTPDCMTQ